MLSTDGTNNLKKSSLWTSIIVAIASLSIGLFLSEIFFRNLLFSQLSFMTHLKRPEFYTTPWELDFFKLRHFFQEKYKESPDKALGWVNGSIKSLDGYSHVDGSNLKGRIPVLLYGDSFAQCHTSVQDCFQGIFNDNPRFNKTHYLLNYGVSGYGIDQIYLLYQKTIDQYHNPIVIVGIMNYDLDRSLMPVTWGIKPFYTVHKGNLLYQNSHLSRDVNDFFLSNPPMIKSYLWRLIINEGPVPSNLQEWLRALPDDKTKIKSINEAIITEFSNDLRSRGIPHLFILFEWPKRLISAPDWRVDFLVETFNKMGSKFITSRNVLSSMEALGQQFDWEKYAVKDGHPNYLYNMLISERISEWINSLDR